MQPGRPSLSAPVAVGLLCLLLLLGASGGVAWAQCAARALPTPAPMPTNDSFDVIDVNNLLCWFSNNGCIGRTARDGTGCLWPAIATTSPLYEHGLILAGRIDGGIHVSGSSMSHGMQAGPILATGATEPDTPRHRVYKVRIMTQGEFDALDTAVKRRMRTDFEQWPVDLGAPFIDSNHNGRYDPDFPAWLSDSSSSDKPWFVGDELLWFVSNDMDPVRTEQFFGCTPMGLEVRTLVWARRDGDPFRNTILIRHTIINKGTRDITDFFIGNKAEQDVGGAQDDCIGIDSTLGMMYAYNDQPMDRIYGIPPAQAFVLLQGPVVPSPDSIAMVGFKRRRGWRNLPVTGFAFHVCGSGTWVYPDHGTKAGAAMMVNNLQGMTGKGVTPIDPCTGRETRLPLAGDPVTGRGWIFPMIKNPCDVAGVFASGPLTLAVGDTQEVVFANIVSLGCSNLHSVMQLRRDVAALRAWFAQMPSEHVPPPSACTVSHTTGGVRISLTCTDRPAQEVTGILTRHDGTVLAELALRDDGGHDDGAANDGVFGARWEVPHELVAVDAAVRCRHADGVVREWPVQRDIPMAGEVRASLHRIESDHRNFDGAANPGENVRVTVAIENRTPYDIGGWTITPLVPALPTTQRLWLPDVIAAGAGGHTVYDPTDDSTFIEFNVPMSAMEGDIIAIPLLITDARGEAWFDTLRVTVHGYTTPPVDMLMAHVAGPSTGALGWRVTNASALKDHRYRVTLRSRQGGSHLIDSLEAMQVEDLVTQQPLLTTVDFPDAHAHVMPVVDGWKATQGTASYHFDVVSTLETHAGPWIEGAPSYRPWEDAPLDWVSRLTRYDLVPVKLVFDRTATQKAYCYLEGGSPNYTCVGWFDVPMRAYDITDSLNPRQITIAFVEHRTGASRDSAWTPDGPGFNNELLYLFLSSHTAEPDTAFTRRRLSADGGRMDILYRGVLRRTADSASYRDGDAWIIRPQIPVSCRDTFLVQPQMLSVLRTGMDVGMRIGCNHPNPFGRGTISGMEETLLPIHLDQRQHAMVRVFDLLGRQVQTAFEGTLDAGVNLVPIRALPVMASGVYTVVLSAGDHHVTRSIMFQR